MADRASELTSDRPSPTLEAANALFSFTDDQPFTFVDDESAYRSLPAGHILLEPTLGSMPTLGRNGRPDQSTLSAADWDVDARSGFMPPEEPLARLSGEYEIWEQALDASRELRLENDERAQQWRADIERMPVLATDRLNTMRHLRRAHVLLTFVANKYVFSGGPRDDNDVPLVPPPIASPLLAVSSRLDIPPVVTYADTVLWNWALKDPSRGQVVDNYRILTTFSGTRTEERFYEVPCNMEALGAPVLRTMAALLDEAFLGDSAAKRKMSTLLIQLATLINRIADIFPSFLPECDPTIFYHQARPWFHGGPRRFVVDSSDPTSDQVLDFGGPSAGQATLIHALDVFLGIDHTPDNDSFDSSFMNRMSQYMPSLHRRFLVHLASHLPTVRELALSAGGNIDLGRAYDTAVSALRHLRETHTRIVISHIVMPAKKAAKAAAYTEAEDKPLVGTGGSDLVTFLRLTRERTVQALLG